MNKKKIVGVVAGFIITFALGIGAGVLISTNMTSAGENVGENAEENPNEAPEHLTSEEQFYLIKLMEQEGSYDAVETYLRELYTESDVEMPEHVISFWEAPIVYEEKLKAVAAMREQTQDYKSSDEWIMRTSFWDEAFFMPED